MFASDMQTATYKPVLFVCKLPAFRLIKVINKNQPLAIRLFTN